MLKPPMPTPISVQPKRSKGKLGTSEMALPKIMADKTRIKEKKRCGMMIPYLGNQYFALKVEMSPVSELILKISEPCS